MQTESKPSDMRVGGLDVALDRDVFVRALLRHLTGALEDVVGVGDASGFVSIVGQTIGGELDAQYRRALSLAELDRTVLSGVLVNLMGRIGGDFHVIEETEERIVFGNRACPFGEMIVGRPVALHDDLEHLRRRRVAQHRVCQGRPRADHRRR